MNEIRALLKIVARKLELTTFIGRLHLTGIMAAGIALGLMLVERTASSAAFVPWVWVGPVLGGLAIGVALFLWMRQRPTEAHVALVVDDRLELREKLSTAIHCQGRDDAFAQAALQDAVAVASDARTHELARRRFAVTPPAAWWVSPLIVLAAVMLSLVHPRNLFAKNPDAAANVVEAKLESEKTIEAVIKSIQDKPELSKELAMGEISPEGTDPNAIRRPEEFKQNALKKLTELNKKLDDILNGEKGKTAEALEKSLNQLKSPEDGPAKEMADALAKGDFAAAQKAMEEMMKKAENGQMDEKEKQKLAEQLKDIADQLDKLAQQQQQLENALKQAGMDPNLAKNAQALQQAMQNNQNLNQQQKQQLQQMAQAQQAAAQACKGLGQAFQQMAQACQGQQGQQGQGQQMAQAAGQMGQQLGQLEQMQQMLQQAQAAMNQCQGQCNGLGQGLNMQQAMQQWSAKNGNQGQWGRAAGGQSQFAKTPTGTKIEQGNVKTDETGDIIAKQLFEGQQVRGESKAALVKVVEAARKGVDEAQTEDQLPRIYQEAQQHYFGELEKLTKPVEAEAGKPAAPAGAGKDAPKADPNKPEDGKPAETKPAEKPADSKPAEKKP